MEALSIEDLVPKKSSFVLSVEMEGVDELVKKTFRVRPFNAGDEAWLKREYGDKIKEIFNPESFDTEAVSRIAFRLIIEEDKPFFKKQKIIQMTEEGDMEEVTIGGYKMLMELIRGPQAKLDVIMALNETFGISRPKLEAMIKKGENPGDEVEKK